MVCGMMRFVAMFRQGHDVIQHTFTEMNTECDVTYVMWHEVM